MNGFISWEKATENVLNMTARVVGDGVKAEIQDVPVSLKHLRSIYFLRRNLKLEELPVEWSTNDDDDSDDDDYEWRDRNRPPTIVDGIEVMDVSYRFEELEELTMGRIHLWGSGNINRFLRDTLYPRSLIDPPTRMNLDLVNYYHYFKWPMAGWESGNEVWRDNTKKNTYLVGGAVQNTAAYLGNIFSREMDEVDLADLLDVKYGEVQVPTEDGVLLYFTGETAVKISEIARSIINEDDEYEFDSRERIWF